MWGWHALKNSRKWTIVRMREAGVLQRRAERASSISRGYWPPREFLSRPQALKPLQAAESGFAQRYLKTLTILPENSHHRA